MSKVVVFPHPYPHTEKRLILAFAKDVNHQTQAAEAGAEIVGGPELVKKVCEMPIIAIIELVLVIL